jgi:predicted ATP-dependent protease
MSENIDALDQRQDDDSHPRDTYTAEDEARMYAAWEKRQQELDAMTRDASGRIVRQAEQRAARTACNLIAYNARVTAMVMESAFGKKGA